MPERPVVPEPHACRDPQEPAHGLADAREAALDRRAGPGPDAAAAQPVICEPWRRSHAAGGAAEPPVLDADALDRHLPMLRDLLPRVADEPERLMAITDAEGPPRARPAADEVGPAEGRRRPEGAMDANGVGAAPALGRPGHACSTEHTARALPRRSCAGAPVTDPGTGHLLGCIGLGATADAPRPAAVALVGAAARLAGFRPEQRMQARDELLRERCLRHLRGLGGGAAALVTGTGRVLAADPEGWRGLRVPAPRDGARVRLPDGRLAVAETLGEVFLLRVAEPGRHDGERPLLTLSLLGADPPRALLDGVALPLTRRHAEILALLALNPRGLDADQLSARLYGDEGNPGTVRAEIHRLRGRLGDLLPARPYRLECELDADFLTLRRLLAGGGAADLAQAARLYQGELLPRSESPALRAERDELAVRLRRQLLDRGGPDALWEYAQTPAGQDDLEILQRLAAVLPPGDPRRAAAQSRAHRVLTEDR